MNVEHIIDMARQVGASDVHLVCGLPVKFRLAGCLENAGVDGDAPLSHDDCEQLARRLAGDGFDRIQRIGELDRAETIGGVRVRINLFRQQGHVSAALRLLSDRIPALETLGLPSAVMDFPRIQRGIVVVTGETGSGKSTTLVAVLSQQLLPRRDGMGRALACELMMVTPAIRNLIREGKTPQIAGSLATSASAGSVTMDNALIALARNRDITSQTAIDAAHDVDYVRKSVR